MATPSNPKPQAVGQPGAWATGCLIVFVALAAAAAGLFVGARWGLPWDFLSPAGKMAGPVSSERPGGPSVKQLWTCGMHPQIIQDHPGLCPICHMELAPMAMGSETGGAPSGALTIDPAVVQNMGVRTARVRRGPVVREIRATGYLAEAQPRKHEVNLRVSGWIDKLYADYDGMFVRAGDPLFDLYSPEIHQAAGELINATRASGGNMAPLGDAARRKLALWGLGKGQIDGIAAMKSAPHAVTFYSPVPGHVLDKHVLEGTGVMAGQKLFDIVDHSQLWMDIAIFERDLPFVDVGDPVSVTTEAHAGEAIDGAIGFILPHVDMMTRAATARLVLDNPGMTYRPGMYATAILRKESKADALLVPREAIIDTGARQLIFLALDEGHFEPREIVAGADAPKGEVEILDGLEEGDLVVTSGQFLLDNESRLREAVQKYLAGGVSDATKGSEVKEENPVKEEAADTPAEAAGDQHADTDGVFQQYLALSESLGKQETATPAIDAKPLLEAAGGLMGQELDGAAKDAAERLRSAVETMASAAPDRQRDAFKAVSAAAIALAKIAPPPINPGAPINEVYCTMAEASWLQRGDTVANPYYADMKTCGEVKGRIPLAGPMP